MIDHNDPRLIDYALGELTPEEAKAVEAELKQPGNAEALKGMKEFQIVAGAAKDALEAEPAGQLRAEQREAVIEQAAAPANVTPITKAPRFLYPRIFTYAVLAACLIATFTFVMPNLLRSRSSGGGDISGRIMKTISVSSLVKEDAPASSVSGDVSVYADPAVAGRGASGSNEGDGGSASRLKAEESRVDAEIQHQEEALGNRYMADSNAASPAPAKVQTQGAAVAEDEADDWTTTMSQIRIGDEETHSLGYTAPPADKLKEVSALPNVTVMSAPEGKQQMNAMRLPPPPSMPMPMPMPMPMRPRHVRGEKYLPIMENAFLNVMGNPLSTFSIDVDTGAYSNVRRFLQQGQLPPANAVRVEEMINYFKYDLAQPTGETPFSVTIEMANCPWAEGHKLARVALQGRTVVSEERNPANLVFLIDVSGSMSNAKKLPLARESMKALLNELEPRDRVAIVTYAGGASVVLNSTSCTEKAIIRTAIDRLQAGGSTHGSAGIQQAYRIARENFISGGINRVLIATDGDFNVGTTSHDALMNLITNEAKSKVFLTVMGFGYGNIKDGTLEQIADKGNGNYAYIDSYTEARRVLVDQISGTLVTIAKDVKIQVEFNPQHVQAYRLIGYENRALAARDFNDDTKDAGEIGAGHQVTALYQLVPTGAALEPGVDVLRYQSKPEPEIDKGGPVNPEWMTVKLRYKKPEGDTSRLIELPWSSTGGDLSQATADMQFASSVAAFGMLLRSSQHRGTVNFDLVMNLAESGKKNDTDRQAFIDLIVGAKTLAASGGTPVPVLRHKRIPNTVQQVL
ncbi:MAG: von Willebrand factor type A domain-containing protein [Candidatus Hydrogenedentes bacterium]|nr:von Willebrand factor type A domain-containing protein [Candidatus Hydrogenedentota bacterium]